MEECPKWPDGVVEGVAGDGARYRLRCWLWRRVELRGFELQRGFGEEDDDDGEIGGVPKGWMKKREPVGEQYINKSI